ncbi:MAG: AbrB/MazE/SpoVT family DNA-binding domain-containing protein [Nitrososphaerota archaeon]|jgi:AbrB family looped-hinge helix DNA binding protein|nr:AbrB/MazE/SpoVT family DNA-binding domain-containing protein [Nitrososphaerota archaeon]MDG6948788.1 AbrB/MazE/SpoVT family DNA-binding domain-containing protein [Nitrososphaerota archaeon]
MNTNNSNRNGRGKRLETKFTVRLRIAGTSYVITIPKPIVDGSNLKEGDLLEIIAPSDGHELRVRPINKNKTA